MSLLMRACAALVQTFANRVGTCANAGLLLAGDTGPDHVLRWFEAYATALHTGYFQVGPEACDRPDESRSDDYSMHAACGPHHSEYFWKCVSMQLINHITVSVVYCLLCLAISR